MIRYFVRPPTSEAKFLDRGQTNFCRKHSTRMSLLISFTMYYPLPLPWPGPGRPSRPSPSGVLKHRCHGLSVFGGKYYAVLERGSLRTEYCFLGAAREIKETWTGASLRQAPLRADECGRWRGQGGHSKRSGNFRSSAPLGTCSFSEWRLPLSEERECGDRR